MKVDLKTLRYLVRNNEVDLNHCQDDLGGYTWWHYLCKELVNTAKNSAYYKEIFAFLVEFKKQIKPEAISILDQGKPLATAYSSCEIYTAYLDEKQDDKAQDFFNLLKILGISTHININVSQLPSHIAPLLANSPSLFLRNTSVLELTGGKKVPMVVSIVGIKERFNPMITNGLRAVEALSPFEFSIVSDGTDLGNRGRIFMEWSETNNYPRGITGVAFLFPSRSGTLLYTVINFNGDQLQSRPDADQAHTAAHEIVHALGLGDTNDSSIIMPPKLDDTMFTLMSYNSHIAPLLKAKAVSVTPMPLDIAALHLLYGLPDLTAIKGNNVYKIREVAEFTNGGQLPVFSIWDPFGNNTLEVECLLDEKTSIAYLNLNTLDSSHKNKFPSHNGVQGFMMTDDTRINSVLLDSSCKASLVIFGPQRPTQFHGNAKKIV